MGHRNDSPNFIINHDQTALIGNKAKLHENIIYNALLLQHDFPS